MVRLNATNTRTKLNDPALLRRGWTEDLIRREETASAIEILGGQARRRARGKVDYVLRVKVTPTAQPVALGLLEAKKEDLPPTHGRKAFQTDAPVVQGAMHTEKT